VLRGMSQINRQNEIVDIGTGFPSLDFNGFTTVVYTKITPLAGQPCQWNAIERLWNKLAGVFSHRTKRAFNRMV